MNEKAKETTLMFSVGLFGNKNDPFSLPYHLAESSVAVLFSAISGGGRGEGYCRGGHFFSLQHQLSCFFGCEGP